MQLGIQIDTGRHIDDVVADVRDARDASFATVWATQIFAADTLTVLAVAAREVDGIAVGTSVVPVQPRHPEALALQALTVQAISRGRLTLGVGLSHQLVVEQLWGLSYDRPATYLSEYLDALIPMLHGEPAAARGELVTAVTMGRVGPEVAAAPGLIVAALGPRMLELAGARTDGTTTWMTGIETLRDYLVPTICAAAADAGRHAPRVVAKVPFCLTDDVEGAAERIDERLATYASLPSYEAMLAKQGATKPSDVSIIGSRARIEEGIAQLEDAGVTETVLVSMGDAAERTATTELFAELATARHPFTGGSWFA